MATAVPDILPNPDVDHWGIGVLFEEDGSDCRRCGSRSPGRSSISLETKEAVVASPRPEIEAKSSPFRRSGAPSPESPRSIRSMTDDIAGLQKQLLHSPERKRLPIHRKNNGILLQTDGIDQYLLIQTKVPAVTRAWKTWRRARSMLDWRQTEGPERRT
ncbi:hypothetical protein CGMCC3_g8961 [Colletotrichum fructicola]|nr:uncharacterized protein CGMCC3_g8961 [Colletotrichum fructicola]KAE9575051.1 hypothetical protein CGMCC3_g8961 [Colletotrichum fructicola]KAF5490716.1 hypothetical protein CGCF413_v011806 [Colletotrichum fructicola]